MRSLQVAVLLFDLVPLERGEVAQTQVDDGLGLLLAEAETVYQAQLGSLGVFARADDANDLVEIGDGDQQAFKDVSPLLGLVELELRAALRSRPTGGRCSGGSCRAGRGSWAHRRRARACSSEGGLHGAVLEELIENDLGDRLPLELDHRRACRSDRTRRAGPRSRDRSCPAPAPRSSR